MPDVLRLHGVEVTNSTLAKPHWEVRRIRSREKQPTYAPIEGGLAFRTPPGEVILAFVARRIASRASSDSLHPMTWPPLASLRSPVTAVSLLHISLQQQGHLKSVPQ